MKKPALQDDAFLADLEAAPIDSDDLFIWWLGQSGFLLQWRGKRLLLDPYLSDSLTKKYANTDKPHVRITERVIAPEKLTGIMAVTSSHNHTDHLDAESLLPLWESNPGMQLVLSEANRCFAAQRLQRDSAEFKGLGPKSNACFVTSDFSISPVPAAHEDLETDESGNYNYIGFLIKFGPWTIYHSGDTVRHDALVKTVRTHRIDAALLPINGRLPERRVPGNLWGREAAQLAKEIGAGLAIPCHYNLFEFNTATPDEFIAECERLGQIHCVLQQGERWRMVREEWCLA